MTTQEINDRIATIRLIHFLEKELHYPNDDFVELFTQENGLTEESRDIVLNNDILASDLAAQYTLDFMGLPKNIKYYLLEPDDRDEKYRYINRERHNKAIILYIVGNRKPTLVRNIYDAVAVANSETVAKDETDTTQRSLQLVLSPDDKGTEETQSIKKTDGLRPILTVSKKPKHHKPAKPTFDLDDFSGIESKFKKANKTISKKKAYKGREF